MKEYSYFENKTFKSFLIFYLSITILYNLYSFFIGFPNGWIALLINGVILLLTLAKSSYLKIGLKVWSVVFLIITPSLQIISKLIKKSLNSDYTLDLISFSKALIFLIIGICVFYFSRTIKLKQK